MKHLVVVWTLLALLAAGDLATPVVAPPGPAALPDPPLIRTVAIPAPIPEIMVARSDSFAAPPHPTEEPISPWADPQRTLIPGGPTNQGPHQDLLESLASIPDFTAAQFTRHLRRYYQAVGFDIPSADFQGWEENATLSFTYPLGDVSQDGVDDLAMNVYCVDPDACNTRYSGSSFPPDPTVSRGRDSCAPPDTSTRPAFYAPSAKGPIPNRIFGIDGANGRVLWQRNQSFLDWSLHDPSLLPHMRPDLVAACPFDFVVGTIPRPDHTGNDILVARVTVAAGRSPYGGWTRNPSAAYGKDHANVALIHNEVSLIDRKDGHTRWTYPSDGVYIATGDPFTRLFGATDQPLYSHAQATNLTLTPLLQIPSTRGVRLIPGATAPALFLDAMGFVATFARTAFAGPGQTQDRPVLESYQPREWNARLNLTTGRTVWANPNPFVAPAGTSQVPMATPGRAPPPWDAPFANKTYWSYQPCCFDLDGDNVPDLPYLTLEWSNTPSQNTVGPFFLASRLVVFSGATGRPVSQSVVEPGAQRYQHEEFTDAPAFRPGFEAVGDVDGDGASDILVHLEYLTDNYHRVLSVRSGKTGAELWHLDRPRNLAVLPVGDTQRDHGNDLLVFEWQDHEFPHTQVYHYQNVTAIPLRLLDGATGRPLWNKTVETFNGPLDLVALFENFKLNGLSDVNHDGVGDVPVDDPLYLPEVETVHRLTYLDGKTGAPLFRFAGIGTFAFVAYAGDLSGDQVDDFCFLSGDITDLWITMYDGHAGTAMWSRRMLTPRVADYRSAMPHLRFVPLATPDPYKTATLLNFHLEVGTIDGGSSTYALYPQVVVYNPNGTVPWAVPGLIDQRSRVLVLGEPSGARAFENLKEAVEGPNGTAQAIGWMGSQALPLAGLFGASLMLAFPMAHSLAKRRPRA